MPRTPPRRLVALVLAVLAVPMVGAGQAAAATPAKGRPGRMTAPAPIPGRVLVRFREGVGRAAASAAHLAAGGIVSEHLEHVGVDVVALAPGASVPEAVAAYRSDPTVAAAEPDLPFTILDVPDDPSFPKLWGLHNTGQPHGLQDPPPYRAAGRSGADIDAPEAWDVTTGSPDTVIAVVDTGLDQTHPDLADSLWTNKAEAEGQPGLDDDGNGYVDDVHGWDFVNGSPSTPDPDGHGTHVAGTIAAQAGNGIGVAGVCPDCRLMALKVAAGRELEGSAVLEALDYAIANGADVVNASFGGAVWSRIQYLAFAEVGEAGILTVAAAGNGDADDDMFLDTDADGYVDSPSFPATFDLPAIVSVTASQHHDRYGYSTGCDLGPGPRWVCAFANWGHDSVDVAAPGVDILSTVPGGGYGYETGTSMAAPHVAGVAGLVLSRHPDWGPVEVKNAIMNSADRPDGLNRLWALPGGPRLGAFTRTSGRVNAAAALDGSTADATPHTDGDVSGAVPMGGTTVTGRVSWPADVNDVYRRWLIQGVKYEVELDGPAGADIDAVVWKPGTTQIWQLEPGCLSGVSACPIRLFLGGTSADEAGTFTPLRSGYFSIQVAAFFSTGSYTLRVARAAA